MEIRNIADELSGNPYPGRGIILGKSKEGSKAVAAYFIMGRSVNSRNRVFVEDGEGIRTQAFDPDKLEDPSLIIYAPVRVLGNKTIVTNGDQTDTIYEGMDKQLSFEQKIQILTSCLKTNSSETLKFAFETLKLPPPFVISFLRNKIDNTVVLYTLYDYYRTAYQNNEIIENTTVEVFSIPYINILILDLKRNGNKMSKDVADLIEYELKLDEFCKNIKLYNLVSKQGYKGFNIYYSKIKIEAHIKENVENLELYNKKYSFRVIGKTTKYYLLFNNSTHQHALLPIELSDAIEKPLISAYIYKIDKKRNVLYVNQLPVPKGYKEPSLLDIGSIVDVSFSLRNERLIPRLRNHTNLLRIKVQNIIMVKDFKQKYKAIVKKRLNDFLFLVEILDSGF